MGLVGAFWSNNSHGNSIFIKSIGEDLTMKKLYTYKLYTPQDIAEILLRKEEEIIALLEKKKTIGRKILGFWYVRGKQVIEIQKLLKGKKSG